MNEEKVKDSNELLNVLMIIIGGLFVFKGVLDFLAWANIITPSWLSGFSGPNATAALSFFGSQGLISVVLGFWCVVAGIGMFREEEWALGQAQVVLSVMSVIGISYIISWFTGGFDVLYWPNYIIIIATIIGILGFFWLLFTVRRYH